MTGAPPSSSRGVPPPAPSEPRLRRAGPPPPLPVDASLAPSPVSGITLPLGTPTRRAYVSPPDALSIGDPSSPVHVIAFDSLGHPPLSSVPVEIELPSKGDPPPPPPLPPSIAKKAGPPSQPTQQRRSAKRASKEDKKNSVSTIQSNNFESVTCTQPCSLNPKVFNL